MQFKDPSARFSTNANDWKLFNEEVPKVLEQYFDQGYKIVVFRHALSSSVFGHERGRRLAGAQRQVCAAVHGRHSSCACDALGGRLLLNAAVLLDIAATSPTSGRSWTAPRRSGCGSARRTPLPRHVHTSLCSDWQPLVGLLQGQHQAMQDAAPLSTRVWSKEAREQAVSLDMQLRKASTAQGSSPVCPV